MTRNALLLVASAMVIAGCVAGPFATAPRSGFNPGGRWILDPASSDDAQKAVLAALPPPPSSRPDPTPFGAPLPDASASGGNRAGDANSNAQVRIVDDGGPRLRQSERVQFVRSIAIPADELVIERQGNELSIEQGDRRRHFELGAQDPSTITDHYGSRRIRAGFDGDSLKVESVDPNRVTIVEAWRAGPEPGTLVSEVTVKAWNFKGIHVRSLYRRQTADAAVARAPATEGPVPRAVH